MKSPCLPASVRRPSWAFSGLFALAAAVSIPAIGRAQTIFIDFGGGGSSETSLPGWNNATGAGAMPSAVSLLDFTTNAASGVSYQITDAFLTTAGNGDQVVVGDFPVSATRDSFYGDNSNPTASITFTGFDPGKQYTFTFLSSRDGVSDNRSTLFSVTGSSTGSVTVDSALGTPVPGSILSISPSVSGSFVLNISKAAENTNGSGFYYLNALKIEAVSAVPEPASFAALASGAALAAAVGLRRRRAVR